MDLGDDAPLSPVSPSRLPQPGFLLKRVKQQASSQSYENAGAAVTSVDTSTPGRAALVERTSNRTSGAVPVRAGGGGGVSAVLSAARDTAEADAAADGLLLLVDHMTEAERLAYARELVIKHRK